MWERGARSPLAPTEPCWGIAGIKSQLKKATMRLTRAGRTPLTPLRSETIRSSTTKRASLRNMSGPLPTEWDSTKLRCRSCRSLGDTALCLSLPKPVVKP